MTANTAYVHGTNTLQTQRSDGMPISGSDEKNAVESRIAMLFSQIAKEAHTTPQEVRASILEAIEAAKHNPDAKDIWENSGAAPTPEELIVALIEQFL